MSEPEPLFKKLTIALQQYAEELEAIKQSLDSAMMLFRMIEQEQIKNLKSFAREHGDDLKEEGESLVFKLPASKITEYRRLERSIQSLKSSQRLMPRNLLVAMVCTYDAFLGKIIRFILESKPKILDCSERLMSFSDLQAFETISEAREYIIEKEIEAVLRKSHVEHFKWLESKLGASFNKGLESWPTFVELTERRNLFVHTDGVVSSQYLSVCNEHKCRLGEHIKSGSRLGVPNSYFQACYQCLYEIGIKLSHVVWRKLLKHDLEPIDNDLNSVTYELIEKRDYEVAIRVLEFFTQSSMPHFDDASLRVMLINLAQAYKWSGQKEKCAELLEKNDWSSTQDRFRLAVAVLKDDWQAAFSIMRRLCHDDEFSKNAFREWPLFKELRKQEQFPTVYEQCYGEAFSSEQEIPAPEQGCSESEQDAAGNGAAAEL